MTTHRARILPAIAAAAVVVLLAAGDASACPVCYGDSDSPTLEGAKMSVAFLGFLIYGLLGSGAAMFVALRRKVRTKLRAMHQDGSQRGPGGGAPLPP